MPCEWFTKVSKSHCDWKTQMHQFTTTTVLLIAHHLVACNPVVFAPLLSSTASVLLIHTVWFVIQPYMPCTLLCRELSAVCQCKPHQPPCTTVALWPLVVPSRSKSERTWGCLFNRLWFANSLAAGYLNRISSLRNRHEMTRLMCIYALSDGERWKQRR